ncbi:MAG: alkaline phosphatase family protein [Minicystis sp.]
MKISRILPRRAASLGSLFLLAACGVEERLDPFVEPPRATSLPTEGTMASSSSGSAGSASTSTTSTTSASTSTSGGGGSGAGGGGSGAGGMAAGGGGSTPDTPITKVFLILMENHNWSQIKGSPSAPYINGLLAEGAHAEQYKNPPGIHPSEPNYLWLEAGTSFGVVNGLPPAINHQSTTQHLVTLLEHAGRSWKSYQEDIPGTNCPLVAMGKYAPKHNPMVFFDDVTNMNDPLSPPCIAHVRPFREIDQDLLDDHIADYNFLTPNLCNDMHDACAPSYNRIKQGDDWLAFQVPKLRASKAYAGGAAIFIVWDEGPGASDGPIGMIALGKKAKVGYENQISYTHSATLRTVQTIFGLSPFLGDAENALDLGDFFTSFP